MITFSTPNFKALAEDWQREGKAFGGLIFAHQLKLPLRMSGLVLLSIYPFKKGLLKIEYIESRSEDR